MKLITAEEARAIDKKFNQYIIELCQIITQAATDGKQEVIIRAAPYCNMLYSTPAPGTLAQRIIEALKSAGYTVSLYYNEAQFVDKGLRINWETNICKD